MKKINTLLIGVGYHAKRIYLPYIKSSECCNLVACWDLISQKEKIEDSLEGLNIFYHGLTTQILSSIYVSAAKQYAGKNGMVNGKIKFRLNNKSYV